MKKTVTLVLSVFVGAIFADKHPPTPGPVYSYYAPYPSTTTTTEATTTTTIPPPPPAPYEPYYDSIYHSNSVDQSYDSGGLYYYYYPASENEIETGETTTVVPETTTVVAEEPFAFSGLQKLFIILIGLSIAFPSRLAINTVRRKRGTK